MPRSSTRLGEWRICQCACGFSVANSPAHENADHGVKCRQNAKVVKFGGGFYCGLVSVKDQTPLYVFNAFFMVMR